jgi:ferredoxin-NADP reductase
MGNPAKLKAVVERIEPHGAGVYHVWLQTESRVPRFKPGQFLHLTLDKFDHTSGYWPESRVFSIASGIKEGFIEIVYGVKGRYTARMEQELTVGLTIWLKLPYGSFIIENLASKGQDIVLVAGGTGISPFISYIKSMLDEVDNETGQGICVLHYGVRAPEYLLYTETIAAVANRNPRFRWKLWLESGEPPAFAIGGPTEVAFGRMDPESVYKDGVSGDGCYFLSGPPPMILFFMEELGKRGVPAERIRIDEWE